MYGVLVVNSTVPAADCTVVATVRYGNRRSGINLDGSINTFSLITINTRSQNRNLSYICKDEKSQYHASISEATNTRITCLDMCFCLYCVLSYQEVCFE